MSKKIIVPAEFEGKVDDLMQINADYSEAFLAQSHELHKYKEKHPTKMLIFKCADGRLLFSKFCKTRLGYLRNFRNIGGKFNMGWLTFQQGLSRILEDNHRAGNGCLAIVTYHFSKGDPKRGCAGYDFNTKKSIEGASGFRGQMERAYRGLCQLYPIVVGIETDEEALILHNNHGGKVYLSKMPTHITEEEMSAYLVAFFGDMPEQMRYDLLPLLMGNIRHIAEVRKSKREIMELDHKEWILGVGGGSAFDFLHIPNVALIAGQYNPNLGKVIKQAFGVIKSHWHDDKKFLTLAAVSYGPGIHEQHARMVVNYYNRLIHEVASEFFHELLPHMYQVRGLIDIETQKMKIV
ncbi:MAG: carboxysome shell carbonic anhydrase [Candidatus Moranbacteria bacterium]|nr:carboxysome shell carbonic anhydrase [Candidatus Moranbacteria bacterium]